LEVGEDLVAEKAVSNSPTAVETEVKEEDRIDDTTESKENIVVESDGEARSLVENGDEGNIDKENPNSGHFEAGDTAPEQAAGTRQESKDTATERDNSKHKITAATGATPTVTAGDEEGKNEENLKVET